LSAGGLALVLRRRWAAAGLLFGLAFLTKQFAVLVLLPALVAAPDGRGRRRIIGAAVTVVVVGLLPFLAVAPHTTLENLSGIGSGGAVTGATVLSILHAPSTVSSIVARDLPIVFALLASWWAWRRSGSRVLETGPLLGLVLACLASRLVFESVIFPYYLLAASVAFVLLDLGLGRLPDRSLAWIAATAAFVALRPDNTTVDAIGTLILAVIAVACGLRQVAAPAGAR
jgi:4-amino-4-deoxy-L-arabinose transferase-like glycosyltransferase